MMHIDWLIKINEEQVNEKRGTFSNQTIRTYLKSSCVDQQKLVSALLLILKLLFYKRCKWNFSRCINKSSSAF